MALRTPIRAQQRRFLHELEPFYSGITEKYVERCTEGAAMRNSEDAEDEPSGHAAHEFLRRRDAVPTLFKYQADLVDQFQAVCRAPDGENTGLLTLPTGAGKTRTAAVALLRLLADDAHRVVLWLAPTRELLGQASATVRAVWLADKSAVDIELVRGDLAAQLPPRLERGILFATPHMVAARLGRRRFPDPDIVVFDEAHHVEAPLFRQTIERIRARRRAAVIGLSATPGRSKDDETERLVDFFGGRLLRSRDLSPDPIGILQRRGVLARVFFKEVPVPTLVSRGTARRSLRDLSFDVDRFRAVVRLAGKLAKKARLLVFAASVDHAMLLAAGLRCDGARAAAVSSRDSIDHRRDTLLEFEHGQLSVLVNKTLLATGYDCPTVRHVILATTIQSAIMFEQIVGRASRGPLVGGSAKSTVWQFEDHLAVHGLPQSYYRYSDYDWQDL